jgi:hypothetical protein
MRPYIRALWERWWKRRGTDVIEENERPHHAALRPWQYSAHFETAKVATAGVDHEIDG